MYLKGYNPPFKYLDWQKGELRFDFLRYDQAPSGPTDVEDFQSSKRIVIIMGVLNYPDFINHSEKLEVEMDRFAKRYPNILLKKIMVFNYNFDSSSSLRMQALPGLLEIFPPDGDCEGGSMWDVHFRQVMGQISVQLVQSLEQQMDHCEDARLRNVFPVNPTLTTGFDDKDDARGGSGKSAKVFRKRPAGRIQKWMGDLSLQVCSPLDAIEHYVAAISESRSQGDSLWLAGALDGYASAILLLQEFQFDLEEAIGKDLRTVNQPPPLNPDDDDDFYDEATEDKAEDGVAHGKNYVPEVFLLAEERATEALNFYATHVTFKNMELESCFRLAKLYESQRMIKHPRRLQKLSEYIMRGVAIPGLSARQQLDAVLEAALVCRRAGLFRKQTKLLYIAALMAADQGNYAIASMLMEHVADHFGVFVGSLSLQQSEEDVEEAENVSSGVPNNSNLDEKLARDIRNGWLDLSISVLGDAAAIAQEAQSPQFTAQVLCRLLALQSAKELDHAANRSLLSQYTRKTLGLEKFVRKKVARGYAPSSAAHSEAVMQLSDHPPSGASILGSSGAGDTGSNAGNSSIAGGLYPPRSLSLAAPSLMTPTASSGIAGNQQNQASIPANRTAGNHTPTPSDRRSVSSVLTTNSFRTNQGGARPPSFNPLLNEPSPSVAQSVDATASVSGLGSNTGAGTEAFLASLRSLSVPKLQLGTHASETHTATSVSATAAHGAAGRTSPARNTQYSGSKITGSTSAKAAPQPNANPRSPEFRHLTRVTQAQVANGNSGRTLSGAHSNSVSQRLMRSLAGDLLALDAATSHNFNLFDSNFGISPPPATTATTTEATSSSSGSNALAVVSGGAATTTGGLSTSTGGNVATGQQQLTASSGAVLAPAGAGASAGAGSSSVSLPDSTLFHLVDISVARDILHYVTSRLVSQHVSLDVQEAVWSNLVDAAVGLAKPARSFGGFLSPNSNFATSMTMVPSNRVNRIQLPVTLLSLRPLRPWDVVSRQYVPSAMVPYSASSSVASSLRALCTEQQEKQAPLTIVASDPVTPANGGTSTSSASASAFYYDPFAARRQQQEKAAAQSSEKVTWCWSEDDVKMQSASSPFVGAHPVGAPSTSSNSAGSIPQGHYLLATLANPLSVSLSLSLICVLRLSSEASDESTAAATSTSNDFSSSPSQVVTVYPIEVEIPPRTMQFEVFLPVNIHSLLHQCNSSQQQNTSLWLKEVSAGKKRLVLRILGLRLLLGGLSEFVAVDSKGTADLSVRSWALQRLVQRQQLQQTTVANKKSSSTGNVSENVKIHVQKPTAQVTEITLLPSPGTIRLLEPPAVNPKPIVGMSSASPSTAVSVLNAGVRQSISLLAGEIRHLKFDLFLQSSAAVRLRGEETFYDVRVRVLQRSAAAGRSVLAADVSNSMVIIRDFSLLSSTAVINAPVTTGTCPGISVQMQPKDNSRYAVDIRIQDVLSCASSTLSLRQPEEFLVDIVFDAVPLTALQYNALQMLRGRSPSALSVLEAIVTPEESKKWVNMPMLQQMLSLQIRRLPATQSLLWHHARPCISSLPEAQAAYLSRALYERLAPLRTKTAAAEDQNRHLTQLLSPGGHLNRGASDGAGGQLPAQTTLTSATPLSATFQPQHIRLKLANNLDTIDKKQQQQPNGSIASSQQQIWQSTLSNETPHSVQLQLLFAVRSEEWDVGNAVELSEKQWTVSAHSSISNIIFSDCDYCRGNDGEDTTNSMKTVMLRWSLWDEIEHRQRQGFLTLCTSQEATNGTNSVSQSSKSTGKNSPKRLQSTNTIPTSHSSHFNNNVKKEELSSDWLQLDVVAVLKSSLLQPIRLAFAKAQSLLTPVLHPLDIRCSFRLASDACEKHGIQAIEIVLLVEEEYASLFDASAGYGGESVREESRSGPNTVSMSSVQVSTATAPTLVHHSGSFSQTMSTTAGNDGLNNAGNVSKNSHGGNHSHGGARTALPAGVFVSGKLRTICSLSSAAEAASGTLISPAVRTCEHAVRVCFIRHGMFTLRWLVRGVSGNKSQYNNNSSNHNVGSAVREESWWTTRHAVTVRVCLDE
jgi:hypothetical protein